MTRIPWIAIAFAACGRLDFAPLDDAAAVDQRLGCSGPHTAFMFRNGVGGYTDSVDTIIDLTSPTTDLSAGDQVRWHDDTPMLQSMQLTLIRFDNIFGGAAIPIGSEICFAGLDITLVDPSVLPAGTVSESAIAWDATTTWDTFGATPGAQPEDVGVTVSDAPYLVGPAEIAVTTSLQSWSIDPARNLGWLIAPAPMNGDAAIAWSNEASAPTTRPALVVEISAR